ncbi:hypothetical protein TNCT_314831 [Trichonephila clavata]|uniref:Uncharacterized protein n=1 Tax=Trichonephila clavata TaxID=2740835 RepID=A0A8X6JVB3_TRICU|nr:hypothetical protein TNCT_314831 [Trichonephila clavata]
METSPTGKNIRLINIPITLREDIIALIKPIKSEVFNWMEDHLGIFTMDQEMPLNAQELFLDFYFNPDGTVDRVKTADLFIHSEEFDVQTRFVVPCQYGSKSDVFAFFKNPHESAREQILHKYSTANENLNKYEKKALQNGFSVTEMDISTNQGVGALHIVTGLTLLFRVDFWIIYHRRNVDIF